MSDEIHRQMAYEALIARNELALSVANRMWWASLPWYKKIWHQTLGRWAR